MVGSVIRNVRMRWAEVAVTVAVGAAGFVRAEPLREFTGFSPVTSRRETRENYAVTEAAKTRTPATLSVRQSDLPAPAESLSGNVYYAVFRRDDRNLDDPWGVGLTDIGDFFRPGVDAKGNPSPLLDSKAKYLYLYQVTNPHKTFPPILSASIKLIVEPRAITSWGYFEARGFATRDADKTLRPVSATHKVDARLHWSPAPALTFTPTLQMVALPKDAKGGIRTAELPIRDDSKEPLLEPETVTLLGSSDFEKHPSVRAIWAGENILREGCRSVVFGFTSDMPPTVEPVRLRSTREAIRWAELAKLEKDRPERPASFRENVHHPVLYPDDANPEVSAFVGVEGRVPTPFPADAALAWHGSALDTVGGLDGGTDLLAPLGTAALGLGGFGPGAGSGFSGGGSGFSGVGSGQGLFSSGGGGNSGGGSSNTPNNPTNPTTPTTPDTPGGGGDVPEVVPEPAAILGMLLGVPALAFVARRRRAKPKA